MKAPATCPDDQLLARMFDEHISDEQQEPVTRHVSSCETCQQRLESLITHGLRQDLNLEHLGDCLLHAAEKEALSTEFVQGFTELLVERTTKFQEQPAELSLGFLEPSEDATSLGRLGQYEITEVIGRGGMGIALKGRDTHLDRIVAVKVLAPELASNPTARTRFLREARAAAAVTHEHVITTYAVEPGDLPYLAMEYIDGRSLQQKLDHDGPLELREILRIGMQTAYGLAAAHSQGLIHRDIKPSNILLQNSVERVQITDFGLARAVDDVTITRTGEVTGTPQYMSPEQAHGLPVDHRADLFSLGCVLYAMCAGRSPFRAESTMAVLNRVCNDSPRPISEVNSEIPDWLITVIDRLLEKHADDRFQTATEVGDLLSRYLAHVQQPVVVPLPEPPPALPSRKNISSSAGRPKWHVGGILLMIAVGAVGLSEATGMTRFAASVISIVRGDGTLIIEVNDPEVSVAIEGGDVVITGAGPKEVRLRPGDYRLRATKNGKPVSIDQELITVLRGGRQVGQVTLKSYETERVKARLPKEARDRQHQWNTQPLAARVWSGPRAGTMGRPSPDGRYISGVNWNNGNLQLHDLSTGETRDLTDDGKWDDSSSFAMWSVFSQDGGRIAYWWMQDGRSTQLRVTDVAGAPPRTIRDWGDSLVHGPLHWSPDGRFLLMLVQGDRPEVADLVRVDSETGVTHRIKAFPRISLRYVDARFNPDGRRIVFSAPPVANSTLRDIFQIDLDGKNEVRLVEHAADDFVLDWTSDARDLVFCSFRQGRPGLWALEFESGKPAGVPRILREMAPFTHIGLARDGTYFYSPGTNYRKTDIFVAALDFESGKVIAPPSPPAGEIEGANVSPDWSPDGKQHIWVSRRQGIGSVLMLRSLEDDRTRLLVPELNFIMNRSLDWSPDGRSLLVTGRGEGLDPGLYKINVESGKAEQISQVPLPDGGAFSYPKWSRDGSAIYYVGDRRKRELLRRCDLKSGKNKVLYRRSKPTVVLSAIAPSPDDQHVAVIEGEELLIIPVSGGDPRAIDGLRAFSAVNWTPDGRHLLVGRADAEDRRDRVTLVGIPAGGGNLIEFDLSMRGIGHLRIHPDGRRITFDTLRGGSSKQSGEVWTLRNFLPHREGDDLSQN